MTSTAAANLAVEPVPLSLEMAVEHLRGADLSQRYYAAWYLGTTADPRAVDPLLEALRDEADRTALGGYPLRRNAAKALGLIGDRRAVPGLIEALACSDDHVVEEAAYALAQLRDPAALSPLIDLLRDPQAPQRPWEALIESIGQLGGQTAHTQQAQDLIRPFLGHDSERVQSAAAWVLYRWTQDPALPPVLLRLLQSENPILRQAALFDLAESGWTGGIEAVVTANVAINLRVIALKRLYTVALEALDPSTDPAQALARSVMAGLDQLF